MRNSQPSPLTLGEIVSRLGGELVGDPALQVRQVATLETAAPDTIAFFANERYLAQLRSTQAGAVIVGLPLRGTLDIAHIAAANPYAYFARVSALFNPPDTRAEGRHPAAVIDPRARIGAGVHFGPNAVIEADADVGDGCSIGAGSYVGPGAVIGAQGIIYPNVSIYRGCVIGRRVIIHSGAVIGADGFGIAMDDGRWLKVPQIGVVRIGDDVEIGANTTIDRGAIDDTVIEDGVKLDNLIQIAHNVHIGRHTAMAGCSAVAGSTRIGAHCTIAGAASIVGHLELADNVHISTNTVVTHSIAQPGQYTGVFPMDDNAKWEKNAATLRQLYRLRERIKALEQARKDDQSATQQ